MAEKQAEWWMGFACQECGAPLAVRRLDDPSKSGPISAAGLRVPCPGCGVTGYYAPGTQMIKIQVSN